MPAHMSKYAIFEEAELVCRMVEAFAQTARPAGLTADEAVSDMHPQMRAEWLRVARAVNQYFIETFEEAPTIQ